jgi:hypothetical protein
MGLRPVLGLLALLLGSVLSNEGPGIAINSRWTVRSPVQADAIFQDTTTQTLVGQRGGAVLSSTSKGKVCTYGTTKQSMWPGA